jgi:hypothetical protein
VKGSYSQQEMIHKIKLYCKHDPEWLENMINTVDYRLQYQLCYRKPDYTILANTNYNQLVYNTAVVRQTSSRLHIPLITRLLFSLEPCTD